MTSMIDLEPPAQQIKTLLTGIADNQLTAKTPCEHYDVGDLLDHLMGLTVAFKHAATKTPLPESEAGEPIGVSRPGEASIDNLSGEWRGRLPLRLDELVAAWRDPAAWQGEATAGGVTLPADVMGGVANDELVLHGWDLARGTGQPFACDPENTQACLEFTSLMAAPGEEAGRAGLFGPVVDVPSDAPLLDRALGFSGRDPLWQSR